MSVAFMGLVGPAGVMPRWYNELVAERAAKGDRSLIDFLDLFNHRLISLFYLSWKKHRFTVNYRPAARDRLSRYLLSLIGLGTAHLLDRLRVSPESLLYCSGLLSRTTPSVAAIEAIVRYFSGARTTVDQFIDRTLTLDPEDQTRLGAANALLGRDTVCGSVINDCQSKFRINLGPLSYRRFESLLPAGNILAPMFSLVRYMVGMEYEFEIRLILKKEEVPPCIPGKEASPSPKLGWNTWLLGPGKSAAKDAQITFQEA
jgi:type VI secretion system protein ImpH